MNAVPRDFVCLSPRVGERVAAVMDLHPPLRPAGIAEVPVVVPQRECLASEEDPLLGRYAAELALEHGLTLAAMSAHRHGLLAGWGKPFGRRCPPMHVG